MSFLDWCFEKYGILFFSEGKVVDRVFIPAVKSCSLDSLILNCNGYTTSHNGVFGLTLPKISFDYLLNQLNSRMTNEGDKNNPELYHRLYFSYLGFDLSNIKQYRIQPPIHLIVKDEETEISFMRCFKKFKPQTCFNALSNSPSIQISTQLLDHLYNEYRAEKSYRTLESIREQQSRLVNLLHQIKKHNQEQLLNQAHALSLDYDNTNVFFNYTEAASVYALSLKIYAELHRDILSEEDYRLFYYAANLIAAYDHFGELKQSLKTDSLFVQCIQYRLCTYLDPEKTPKSGLPLIAKVTKDNGQEFFATIRKNAEDLLYGNPEVDLNGKKIAIQRFLPDTNNFSETNEIVFQGGGMLGHSASYRLVKIPRLVDGNRVYYEYFKIENNLGSRCASVNPEEKTCLGTYVTKLRPFARKGDQFVLVDYNPLTHPQEYQEAMEETLKELILVEREILFYREAADIKHGHFSDPNSEEGIEWIRLYKIKCLLSGIPYPNQLSYTVKDAFNPSNKYIYKVQNHKDYLQEGGSCVIYSLKSLVESVIGPNLSTLHNSFMQQHDGKGYERALKKEINKNKNYIESVSALVFPVKTYHVHILLAAFKRFLHVELTSELKGLKVVPSENPYEATIMLFNSHLKKSWPSFIESWNKEQAKIAQTNYYIFFNQRQNFSAPTQTLDLMLHNGP